MVVVEPLESAEIVRRGWALYDARIRSEVEAEHDGRFLVIDVDSGRYVLADEELEAFDRARETMPGGTFYLMRVGRRAAHRIGRGTAR
jgi:hypothetical protein